VRTSENPHTCLIGTVDYVTVQRETDEVMGLDAPSTIYTHFWKEGGCIEKRTIKFSKYVMENKPHYYLFFSFSFL